MTHTNRIRAGVVVFIGTAGFLMGIIVSAALYPGSQVTQMIRDPGCGSTAAIFNSAVFGFGLLLIAAACLLQAAAASACFLSCRP
jgi:hypothetical membrane protein